MSGSFIIQDEEEATFITFFEFCKTYTPSNEKEYFKIRQKDQYYMRFAQNTSGDYNYYYITTSI
jgi:hypothetical protein